MNENQKLLTVKEAALYLRLKPSYIYQLVYFGKIQAFQPGGKLLLFKQSDLEAYAFSNAKGGRAQRAESILTKGR